MKVLRFLLLSSWFFLEKHASYLHLYSFRTTQIPQSHLVSFYWQVHISKERVQSVQSKDKLKTKLDGFIIGLDFMSPGEGQAARGEMTNQKKKKK